MNLLREELQACEKQILGLEITRESDSINGAIFAQMDHCASDMSGVSMEINRYKGLYGDSADVGAHWDLLREASDIDRDSLEFPSHRAWDDDAADSSDSLEDPFVTGGVALNNNPAYGGRLHGGRACDQGADDSRNVLKRNGRCVS